MATSKDERRTALMSLAARRHNRPYLLRQLPQHTDAAEQPAPPVTGLPIAHLALAATRRSTSRTGC